MRKFLILLIGLSSFISVFAQESDLDCTLIISPRDTVIYAESNDSIILPLSLQYTDSIIDIRWTGGNINGSHNLNPTTKNPINETVGYGVYVTFESNRNLISNGDFERGNKSFTSDYTYTSNPTTFHNQGAWQCYVIGSDPANYQNEWTNCTGHGNYLFADGSAIGDKAVYKYNVTLLPNTDYAFYIEATSLHYSSAANEHPRLAYYVNNTLMAIDTLNGSACNWNTTRFVYSNGNSTSVELKIVDQCLTQNSNDFAIDNIKCHELCYAFDTITVQTIGFIYEDYQVEICQGEQFIFQDVVLDSTCTYTDTIFENNMFNVLTLELTVNPVYLDSIEETICANKTFNFLGHIVSEPGVYIDTLQSINGCDSVIVLTLNQVPTYDDTITAVICNGEIYEDFNFSETHSGNYTQKLESIFGCDSLITLSLVVNPTSLTEYNATIGEEERYTYYGFDADSSGTYYQYYQNEFGCDSILVLNLVVNRSLIIRTPNAFMPQRSGDENIQYFHLYPNADDILVKTWQIYDRWGTVVFSSTDINDYWDGTYKGTLCPQGVYVYRAQIYRQGNPDIIIDQSGEVMLIH